jgi:5-methylcytosine-specific restriction endonuclease McrA
MNIIANNETLPQEVFNFLLQTGRNPLKYKTGNVCRRNHTFNDQDFTIRLLVDGSCLYCNREIKTKYWENYYRDNLERLNKYRSNYLKINASKIAIRQKKYKLEHSEQIKKWQEVYNKENIERNRERCRIYAKNNPEVMKLKAHKYKATKISQTEGKILVKDLKDLEKLFNNRCAYCGISLRKVERHLDHVKPLSRKGKHSIDNLVPACRRCNLTKKDALLIDWYPKQSFHSLARHRKILVHIKDVDSYNNLVAGNSTARF